MGLYVLKCPYILISIVLLNIVFSLERIQSKNFGVSDLPVIIWWTQLLFPHIEQTSKINCSHGSCISTLNKESRHLKKNTHLAFLFYGSDFDPENLPLPRHQNHIWALLHEESPMNNFIFSHTPGISLFNFSSTFSRYSDFPLTTQFIPSIEYFSVRKPVFLQIKNKLRKEGFAPVLYLQSHCHVASDRDSYVHELMKYIQIDSYGICLQNKKLPDYLSSTETYNDEKLFDFISNYKFHLAFENAICDDYITEKLYRAFHVGSVPIYYGSQTVKDWIPANKSIIVVDDFSNPKELADFITHLDENDGLYDEYLEFKRTGITNSLLKNTLVDRSWGVNDVNKLDFIQGFECYICDKIHKINNLHSAFIANRKHMNCPQPHFSSPTFGHDKLHKDWLKQEWIEDYWFAVDKAKAVQMMIENKDKDTSKFMKYIMNKKY